MNPEKSERIDNSIEDISIFLRFSHFDAPSIGYAHHLVETWYSYMMVEPNILYFIALWRCIPQMLCALIFCENVLNLAHPLLFRARNLLWRTASNKSKTMRLMIPHSKTTPPFRITRSETCGLFCHRPALTDKILADQYGPNLLISLSRCKPKRLPNRALSRG